MKDFFIDSITTNHLRLRFLNSKGLVVNKSLKEFTLNLEVNARLHVYLAGPDVFAPDPIKIGAEKKRLVTEAGHIGHFPMDPEFDSFGNNKETAYKIGAANEGLMKMSQVILANMTPFRGSSMDVGTAFEVGYMSYKYDSDPYVLIIGYYENECELNYAKRLTDLTYNGNVTIEEHGVLRGGDGMSLENFDLSENLMIPAAIHKTGGEIYMSFQEAVNNIQVLWNKKITSMAINLD